MTQVLSLALPFFGLIFIGYVCGKLKKLPPEGLAWLNFFIVYISLPALFFQLLSKTPIEELANGAYVATTTFATYTAFSFAFVVGILSTKGHIRESTILALAGGYSNVGYMGPGLTLAALGPDATVPTALIFCFDNALLFTLVPLLMGLGAPERQSAWKTLAVILRRIFLHPFILASFVGVGAAAIGFHPPLVIEKILTSLMGAAAPCALFALGVTVALRPIDRIPREVSIALAIKLLFHPLLLLVLLAIVGGFDRVWIHTAILMASLPPALNVFVLAQQYEVYVTRASSIVLVGTGLSVATVTTVLYLITHDMVPINLFAQ